MKRSKKLNLKRKGPSPWLPQAFHHKEMTIIPNNYVSSFDMILQIQANGLKRILNAQHTAEVIFHSYLGYFTNRKINLVINSPDISFTNINNPITPNVGVRVFYYSRDESIDDDFGYGMVSDLLLNPQITLTTGNPTLITSDTKLSLDASNVTTNDITVHSSDNNKISEAKNAITQFCRELRGEYEIPPIGQSSERIGYLGIKSLVSANNSVIIFAMNIGNTIKGNLSHLTRIYSNNHEWSLALSPSYVLSKINESIRNHFNGSPPPPLGSNHVKLDKKCTARVFGSCVNHQTIFLESFIVSISNNGIEFSGSIWVKNTGYLVPDLWFNFNAKTNLSINTNQQISVQISDITVTAANFWASLLQAFLGDLINDIAQDAIKDAFSSGSSSSFSAFFTKEWTSEFASMGTSKNVDISPVTQSISINANAVIIHGNFQIFNEHKSPIAAFSAIPRGMCNIYEACESWAPGGTIDRLKWTLPDKTIITEGINIKIIQSYCVEADHSDEELSDDIFERMEQLEEDLRAASALARSTLCCLEVTDDRNHNTRICQEGMHSGLMHGELVLAHITTLECIPYYQSSSFYFDNPFKLDFSRREEWQVPDREGVQYPVQFLVRCGDTPVKDVEVILTGENWKKSEKTSDSGRVFFYIDSSKFNNVGTSKLFVTGKITVKAQRKGFKSASNILWKVADVDRRKFIEKHDKTLNSCIDKLKLITKSHFASNVNNLFLELDILRKIMLILDSNMDVPNILLLQREKIGKFSLEEIVDKQISMLIKRVQNGISSIRFKDSPIDLGRELYSLEEDNKYKKMD